MPHNLDDAVVFEALADAVVQTCFVDPASLDPKGTFGELGIDSLDAADIVVRAQSQLGVELDFRQLPSDWSDLTLGELATKVAKMISDRPAPTVTIISLPPQDAGHAAPPAQPGD